MRKSFLIGALLVVIPAVAQQRKIPYGTVQALKGRMTDLKSSLFLLDSLYQDYISVGQFLVQDDEKSDLVEDGSTWIRNRYLSLGEKYPKQCQECEVKANELMQLNDRELRDAQDIQYRKIIQKADDCFQQKDFLKAKEYYTRAVNFRPSDPYPKNKLKEVDALIEEQEKKAKQ